ncbi:MAG: PilN domain-containing protein [Armatimonadota bacterium]
MIDINLVAERQRQRRTSERFARASLIIVMVFLVATVAVFTVSQVTLSNRRAQYRKLENEVATWQEQKKEVDALREQLEAKEPLVQLLNEARDSERLWCAVLRDISLAVPEGVALRSVVSSSAIRLSIKPEGATSPQPAQRGVTVDGSALQWERIGQFMTNLQNMPSFSETWLTATSLQQAAPGDQGVYRFEIIAILADAEQGADAA